MKPKIIFSAVGLICALMAVTLPNIAAARPASAALPAASQAQVMKTVVMQQATALPTAVVESSIAVVRTAAPTMAPLTGADGPDILPWDGPALPPEVESTLAAEAAIPNTAQVAIGLPDLESFIAAVRSPVASLVGGYVPVTGVYVPGQFALPVLPQPTGQNDYVSPEDNTITQYMKPERYGVLGLLAHNYLSGAQFFDLQRGQEIAVVYGSGQVERYLVSEIQRYQALEPHSSASDFLDLSAPGSPILSHQQVFDRVYTLSGKVVFQTCIEAEGELSWGRLFVIASPID